jgi:glycosyltransferase 2 family protein
MNLKKILLILMGLGFVAALIMLLEPEQVTGVLFKITPKALGVLFSLQLLTLAAGAWIWHLLLSRNSRISLVSVFIISQAASLVESLTPSVKFGGEAARIYLFRKKTGQSFHSLAGVLLVQKFLTMIPFAALCVLLFLPALIFFDLPASFTLALVLLLIICLGLVWLCYGESRIQKISLIPEHQNTNDQNDYPGKKTISLKAWTSKTICFLSRARASASGLLTRRETTGALLISFGIWVLYPVKVYLVCHFLGIEVNPVIIGLATIFAYMISMLPLLPGGLGVYEGGMAMFFTLGGLSPAEGLAIALTSRFVTFWFPLALSALASGTLFLKSRPGLICFPG